MKDTPETGSGAEPRRGKVFYGWWIVAAGGFLHVLAGGTFQSGFSVYFLPLERDLGLKRAATSVAFGLGRLEGGFESPLSGYLADRFGSRVMVAGGGILAGVGFLLLSVTHNFPMFVIVYVGVLTLGINAGFNHGVMAAINQWFIRRKGLAMSMTSMGNSLGGATITPVVAFIVLTAGWRTASLMSGMVMLAAVIPLSFVFRNSPESMGLLPDGDTAPPATAQPGPDPESSRFGRHVTTVDYTAKEAFRTRAYWLLTLAMGLRMAAPTGVFVHLVPLMVWKDQTEATGAFIVAFVAFASVPLRVFIGWMGDRWAKQKTVGITMFLGAVSLMVLLLSEGQLWRLLIFATIFAFAESGGGLSWSLIGDFFGRRSFATLRGWISAAHSFMSMGAPVFAGWVYDVTGSYSYALIPMVVVYLMAGLLFWYLPKPRLPSRATEPTPGTLAAG